MQSSLLSQFGEPLERVERAIAALQQGEGVLVVDDENRENEGDFVYSAQHLTTEQMAMMIREGSGIVCLCMGDERVKQLDLPQMVEHNTSQNKTAYTVTIEAKTGVTTGVSAADRVTTIKAATADNAKPEDLSRPGHVFGLRAQTGGVLVRRGHTEASVDLMQLAGLTPFGVICELTNPDGSMARLPEVSKFASEHNMPVVSIEDLVAYIQATQKQAC
ncbi:3,4-dihydroxy-2-butanone-4-phosphate synthase [Pseudoalteromonas shioyasakiensis]|uniref:3,4-dihydroxy-2-butanone 4-phosphate synthase n=1 Tax=Pseudoalteromonas lipolytica TaxID=570156 RepID=A0ABU8SN17_9GAMM|nr:MULTISPECIES: 3,4-dihydroxy-2-butanone-4-phosphate synthase [Pseudoalteromonas]MCO7206613.1 3,4-dihydroxy-2-butanone-4-phosphate synthase [Pseudoalteromonas sp. CnMc7-37]MCF2922671.1 3,4-dihydroxy-2-butanone-4-phosphate synthase [Pseudoalteromonas sp. APAL1]MCO6353728.1 3,4-dihydroxy-2-butanone-4-phosphate synthase [Pseudoalteromonas shioyasakiensis]MDI4652061.1 3,4-dihydroxy-2-butanone-4-phosphate synthase [Pseudoalteromonas shioyasakiensis]HAU06024.1 3,4-dihydroxy-2-butanone-4-phosphate s